MNREERYTTVTLTINGESAKKTLEELSRKAEELGEKIRLIQGRGTRDEGREPGAGVPGVPSDADLATIRRLEGELARVLGEIEAIESGAESVEGVMGRILQDVEKRKGLQLIGDVFKLPDWFLNKHRKKDVNIGGMTLAEAAELYRILSDVRDEVRGTRYERLSGERSAESGEAVHRNEGRGTRDGGRASVKRGAFIFKRWRFFAALED